jgi:hypothetical protein
LKARVAYPAAVRLALLAALLLALPPAARAYDPFEDEPPGAESAARFLLIGWGGGYLPVPGSGARGAGIAGLEAAARLGGMDLGVQALGARIDPKREISPVILARLSQRFETRRGVEGVLTLGLGAARREHWTGWFQFGFGARVPLGPAFLAAELAFEQVDLIRLAAGVGVAF